METIGGIRITRRRPPLWILVVIALVVSWGLFYLINFSITETGTFQSPEALGALSLTLGP